MTVAGGQTVTIIATPAATSPDLDVLLTLAPADGSTVLPNNNPIPLSVILGVAATGMGTSITGTPGTYTVTVDASASGMRAVPDSRTMRASAATPSVPG